MADTLLQKDSAGEPCVRVALLLMNSGLAEIGIDYLMLFRGVLFRDILWHIITTDERIEGPELPATLKGGASESWIFELRRITVHGEQIDDPTRIYWILRPMRVIVGLGNGKSIRYTRRRLASRLSVRTDAPKRRWREYIETILPE